MHNSKQSSSIQRIIILGHTGFVGSYLEKHFLKTFSEIEMIGHSTVSIDLTKEKEVNTLAEFLNQQTVVILCSAIKRQLGDNLDIFSKNIQMVANLSRLLQNHSIKKIVYFSSTSVYGEEVHNLNITETTSAHPTSYYGIAKFTSECLLRNAIDSQENTSLLILRPPLIYGPKDRSLSYGPSKFTKSAVEGTQITLWGDGTEKREFLFIDDLVEITSRLLFNEDQGILNIASGTSHTFKNILDNISRLQPSPLRVNSRLRSKSKVDNVFNNQVLNQHLPDFSFTSLEEGIKLTLEAESLLL